MLVEGDGRDVSGDAVGEKRNRINMDLGAVPIEQCPNKTSKPRRRSLGGGTGGSISNSGMFGYILPSWFVMRHRADR